MLANERYSDIFDRRGIRSAEVYPVPQMAYPTPEEIAQLNLVPVVWKVGMHFWQLAEEHYGRPQRWDVIAWFNQKPSEALLRYGDVIYVPKPLERILDLLGV